MRKVADFGDVSAGDTGGWIEKERNLSQSGKAWVYENCFVYGNARVHGNAKIRADGGQGCVCIYDDVLICEDAKVHERAGLRDEHEERRRTKWHLRKV